ncbi:MAG: RsmG family class I SAM-dependent methyltransferase [Actinomycetota bacterium]
MVARETSIRSWLEAQGVFPIPPDAPERLKKLTDLLETEGVSRGIIGPNEKSRLLARHVLESCALLRFVGDEGLLVDVGSGAGLPGLPLASIRRSPVTMIESQARRAAFIRYTIAELALESAEVLHARAEDAARGELRETASAVVARALAAPAVALELCLPFARVGGVVVIPVGGSRGPEANDMRGAAEPSGAGRSGAGTLARVAAELGGGEPRWEPMGRPTSQRSIGILGPNESRLVLVVPKLEPTAERYPRRVGVPSRRPLG